MKIIDAGGGALGQFYDPPKNTPFRYYEGSFGAFPLQVAAGGTFALALLPNGKVTNIGAFGVVAFGAEDAIFYIDRYLDGNIIIDAAATK